MFGKLLKKGKASEIEPQLKEALGKENWNAPNSLLQELALCTEDDANRQEIFQAIWKLLDESKPLWRRVLKALALLEVILKRGSVRAVEDMKRDMHRVQRWQNHHQMEDGRDIAGGIREKANNIVQLLGNPRQLNQERQKNYELYAKFQGVGIEVKEKESTVDKAMASAKKIKDAATGNNEAAVEREAARHQKEVQVFLAVQEFVNKTGAPDHVARHFLRRHRGNMQNAMAEFAAQNGGAGAGGATPTGGAAAQQKPQRPSFSQAREMCEQVKMIADCSDGEAAKLLEQCGWDVEKAIDKASQMAPVAAKPKQPEPESDDSDSDSDSSDDESEASPVHNRGGQASGWPATQQATTPRGGQQGAWGQQQGFGGPQGGFGGQQNNQQNGFNGNGNGFGAQGGFGGQQSNQQGGFGGQQGGRGGQQGNQQGGWGGQQAGFGQNGRQQGAFGGQQGNQGGFGGQQGGFGGQQGNQQAGFGGQQGGFGGQQGGFGGNQQGGFGGGGQQGGFGGQQVGFGGQMGGGFGGQQGGFGGKGAGGFGGGYSNQGGNFGGW